MSVKKAKEKKIKKLEVQPSGKRIYKNLGYTGMETLSIISSLNTLISNYHVHYQKMRNFHWNVKGNDFFELHEIFEELYDMAKLNIDELAERVRVFGQTPVSTLKEYLEASEIKEVGTDLSGEMMVKETLHDFETLLSMMVDVADAAIEIGDVGTEDMINTYIKNLEKRHWMFTAWLNEAITSKNN
ncbi:MAG: DNA starvation/stationary phase protection protein [Chitinophagales bacterium]|nr:DNA starvation/stationary phase protection protein [Chitinophagales bacterium]